MANGEFLTITMAAQRTNLEYALGAAAAIAAAREFGGKIEDPWRFFSSSVEVSSEDLERHLRLESMPASPNDIREAAEHLAFESSSAGRIPRNWTANHGRTYDRNRGNMSVRENVHQLVDTLPEDRLEDAFELLSELGSDDDTLTAEEEAALERALEDVRQGRTIPLEEFKRTHGL